MALKHVIPHGGTKGILLTLFTIVLFVLMLSELITYVVLNIDYNSLSMEVGQASSTSAIAQNVNSSLSAFLHSSLGSALAGLTYYESTPTIRKDSFVNNTGLALATIMQTGAYNGYSLSGYERTTLGQYIAALARQSGLQAASINITNGTLSVFQSGPFTLGASYTAMLTVNRAGAISNYPIDAVANVSTSFRQYLPGAEQGIPGILTPGTSSPNATVVGGIYAQSGSTSPYMFAYGTVVYYSGAPNCGSIASQYKNGNYILATPNAQNIGQGVCSMAGLVTNRTNASTPLVPYLRYKNASIMNYLQGSPSLLLAGSRLALLNTTPLQQAVQSGYAYASPYMPSYLQRSQNSLFGSSTNGFYTFSPLNVKAAQFNGADSYVEVPNSQTVNITGKSITITAWVDLANTQPSGTAGIVVKWDQGPGDQYFLGVDGSTRKPLVALGNIDDNGHILGDAIPSNMWEFIAFTYNGTEEAVYQNGAATGTNLLSGSFSDNGGPVRFVSIGAEAQYGIRYLNGSIADVQLYNASLSPAQISRLYGEGVGGAPIANSGLAGWWPFNGNATDLSGFGNSGTPANVIYGPLQAYAYDLPTGQLPGTYASTVGHFTPNQNISIQTSSPILQGSNATMAVWINWNGNSPGGRQEILGADSSPGSEINPIIAVNDSGTQEAETWVCASTCWAEAKSGPDTIAPHNWYFLASRYNGSAVSLWINGQEVSATADTGNLQLQGSGLYSYIGSRSNTGDYFNGLIADAQMYGSALTAAEIQQLYSDGLDGGPVAGANVVGWWPLTGNANDYSGNGNSGVPHGATFANLAVSPTAGLVEGVLNCGNLDQCSNTSLQHLYLNPLPLEHAGLGFANETTSLGLMGATLPDVMSLNMSGSYAWAPIGSYFGANNPLTASEWVYVSPSTFGPSLGISSNAGVGGGWCMPFLSVNATKVTGWIWGINPITATVAQGWHQLTLTYGASQETLYVDGKAVGSQSGSYSPSSAYDYWETDNPCQTQYSRGVANFNGKLADIQFYSSALTSAQAQQLYLNNSVLGVTPTEYWPLGTGMNGLLNETPELISGLTGKIYIASTACTNSQVVNGQCGPAFTPP